VPAWVPYRFCANGRIVLIGHRGVRRDGVDDLPVGERVPVPAEMRRQVQRRLGDLGADDEPQVRRVEFGEVLRRQHPGVGDHDHLGQLVTIGERGNDRDDRGGLGPVALEAADLEREPLPVHE
jgi:hypothetical protein